MRRIVRGLIVAAGIGCIGLAGTHAYGEQGTEPAAQTGANGASPATVTGDPVEAADGAQIAQPTGVVAEPSRRVSVTAGFEFLTAYLFRGIYQEDHGLIMPPFVDAGISVYEGEGTLKSVTINAGNWNSLHSGSSGHSGFGNAWYEADYYGSVSFTLGKWTPGALFTSYTSPNNAFNTVHELAAVLSYDDSASAFPLSPSATLAFELHGQADGGDNRGTYLELGISPEFTLVDAPRYPLSLSIPVTLGMSLKDYYEGPAGSNRFGFFDVGAVASVPLAFMSGRTRWEVHGGVNVMFLGDNLRLFNSGDRVKPVGIVGLSVTY
jgi:hypothetical protein